MISKDFIVNNNGISISGHFTISKSDHKLPLVIILTGWNSPCNKKTYLDFEQVALDKNYAVIRYDHPGHGQSGGNIEDVTIPSATDALAAVVNYAQSFNDQLDLSSTTLLAGSLAAEIALRYTSQKKNIKNLIFVSPGFGKGSSKTQKNMSRELFWDNIVDFTGITFEDYKNKISSIQVPICIIHGDKDSRVPISQSHELQKIIGENVTIDIIEGMDHKPGDEEEIAERLKRLAKYL